MSDIAIVVPTIREIQFESFKRSWNELFTRHEVTLIAVHDGDEPYLEIDNKITDFDVISEFKDLLYNKNDGIRNAGFAYIAKYMPHIQYIFSFDDDVLPEGDTIQDHIDALNKKVPVTWLSTANIYMRGFPYGIRQEAEVVLSHGIWSHVPDFDAPTQLIRGATDEGVVYYKGPIPKGIFYPHCAMNFAFKRKLLPYVYQAPMGERVGLDRFADIWMGIECKKEIDSHEWAVVTGYATVRHERASNVFTNLVKEAKGLGMNENQAYGKGEYFELYREKREKWKESISFYI